MVSVIVDLEASYYAIINSCEQCFNETIFDNLLNFVHLAVFWKMITNMSMYNIDVNLVLIKLENLNFVDEAVNILATSIDVAINDTNTMMMNLMQIVQENLNDDTSECIYEPVCPFQSEIKRGMIMQDIIDGLLDQVTFGTDPSDPTDNSLYDTLEMFKQINSDITIEQKQIQD